MQFAAGAEPLRVLVVDDDSALIRTLSDILRLNGYEAATAASGTEGLALAEERPPALAVVDLRLPDMDGMELAARLHELSSLTEVVVLTGNASLESAVAALREHSVDYLVKPVNVQHLLHVASAATERWQRRHAEERLRQTDERYRKSLEVRASQQAAVAGLGHQALSADSESELLQEVVELVSRTLDVPFSSALERRSDGASLVYRACVGWKNITVGKTSFSIEGTQAGHTLLNNEPVIVTDLVSDSRFGASAIMRQYDVASGITVLIPGPVAPYGVLEAHDTRPRDFTQDDAHFLQAIAHVLGTALERFRSEAALRQAQRLEAVGRLASGVAHDFNNMLTAITAYSEMLKAGLRPEDPLRDDVEEILKASDRAATLTKQLLAFSRQQTLQPRVVRLNDVVGGMENMLARLIGSRVEFRKTLAPDLGLIKADPGQLEQVIMNLCVNARDAMQNGGILELHTANVELDGHQSRDLAVEKPGPYVMLAVTDSGSGMDAETRSRIFEPFFSTKADKGTGLGLATVYGIVKQSGGEIWVYTEINRGTTFKVFFPRVDETPDDQQQSAKSSLPHGTETILVTDDEGPIVKVAKRILESVGYTVLAARSGDEALHLASEYEGDIHLLVTDMVMPAIGGRELAEKLRGMRRNLRVLYLSGYTDTTATRHGLMEPNADFLQKPFSSERLVRRVREVLDVAR